MVVRDADRERKTQHDKDAQSYLRERASSRAA